MFYFQFFQPNYIFINSNPFKQPRCKYNFEGIFFTSFESSFSERNLIMTKHNQQHTTFYAFRYNRRSTRTRPTHLSSKCDSAPASLAQPEMQKAARCIFVDVGHCIIDVSGPVTRSQSGVATTSTRRRCNKKHATSQPASSHSRLWSCIRRHVHLHFTLASFRCAALGSTETQWSCTARPPLCLIKCSSWAERERDVLTSTFCAGGLQKERRRRHAHALIH